MALDLARWLGFGPTPIETREGYALWSETYPSRPHNPLMQAEQSVVVPILEAASPRRALDAGTGTGRYLPLLVSAGARLAIGLDASLPMLRHNTDAVPRVCGDVCHLPFPDASFDLVCASLMVGDLENLHGWIREATRVLTRGGHLVYSDFHPSWTGKRWRRTFRNATGQLFELSYFPHAIEEHLALLEQASLTVQAIREPRLAERSAPVVVVFHAIRSRRC